VTDGIEPGPATCPTNGQGEFGRLLRSPPIPAELSANYARTQWNLAPLWRGFSFSENSLGRRPQKSPPAIGAAAALFHREHRKPAGAFFPAVYLEFAASALKRPPKEIAPRVTRAAVLRDSANPAGIAQFGAIRAAASSLGGPAGVTHIDRRQLHPRLTCGSNSGLIVTISPAGSASRASD
jgi:hypothetical protein